MPYTEILISDLLVSNKNDRHGDVESEQIAIEWLLQSYSQRMLNLAKDISRTGIIYEPPLVTKEGGKFRVFDGNRRVSVIKILTDISLLPASIKKDAWEPYAALWKQRNIKKKLPVE